MKMRHESGEPRSRNGPCQGESTHQIREEIFPHNQLYKHPLPARTTSRRDADFSCLLLFIQPLLMSELDISAQTRQKNKNKLIQQNTRLRTELTQLEKEIDALEEQFNKTPAQQPQIAEIRIQIQMQERQIRQLKEVVDAGRQSNAKQNMYYIKKEEDELAWLKQELQTFSKEKEVVGQSHQDKVRKLAANEPLLKHKQEITKNWSQTKKQNREMSLKMVELQREIRRLHALKEIAKNSDASPVTNQELELATLQTEIARMNAQMKMKELKWKPNGQVLDNQYFTNRSTIQVMQRKIEQLEKEEGVWRTRAAALRDGPQILSDRERLSKVVTASKPQHIIKPPIPSVLKQPVKPQSMEKIMKRDIKDNTKNDKFVDMVRVASTPSSTIKKSIQLQPIQVDTKQKQKKMVEIIKEDKVSSPVSSFKMKKSESLHSSIKREKSQNEFSIESNVIKQPSGFENKNGNNWMGRRGKIKSKQAVNSSNLAELIHQKADEVKKINKQEKEEKERERSVSSPKKVRDKKGSIDRMQSSSHLKNRKEKIKQKISKQGNSDPPEPKFEYRRQPSSVDKSLKEPRSPKVSQVIKQIQPIPIEKKKQSGKKISTPKKEVQLVEKITIISKINNFPQEKKTPKKTEASIIAKQPKLSKQPIQQLQIKGEKSIQKKPQSPQNRQRPVFQILMSDNAKPITTVTNQGASSLQDENDGVPKIIKRKRKVQGQQVTTGTST